MRADVVKMYKDVHTWVGIVSGLMLLIAFFAGAITMFETPLKRWASPPVEATRITPIEQTPELVDATLAAHPEAARNYTIHVQTGPETPARMSWTVWPEGRGHGKPMLTYFSDLNADGSINVRTDQTSPVAEFIDHLHREVGLPFGHEISNTVMGIVSLLYGVALISGVIILLPSLVKDLFALRLNKNEKRVWLDVHNVVGFFSLPFHIIMACTAVGFAFHDQFYDIQDKYVYDGQIRQMFAANETPHDVHPIDGQVFLSADQMVVRLQEQAPQFDVKAMQYITGRDGSFEVRVTGEDLRYGHRGPDFGIAAVHPYTGKILSTEYMPGRQNGWTATVTSFFALHFGNFGGAPIRWAYVVLGLSGAFLFYTGNLLWIESRRKRVRKSNPDAKQPMKTKLLGSLTVGVTFGCIAGIGLTIAAAKLLPALTHDLEPSHMLIYYAVFAAALIWAFIRGTAKSALELQLFSVATLLAIPLVSLLSAIVPGFGWNHSGTVIIDVTALVGALVLLVTASRTSRRIRTAPEDSIWFAGETAPKAVPAE